MSLPIAELSDALVDRLLDPEAKRRLEQLPRTNLNEFGFDPFGFSPEFFRYALNNGLTPFFYNSESDFRRRGNLAERKNRRNEEVVDRSLRTRRSAKKVSESYGQAGPASTALAKSSECEKAGARIRPGSAWSA